MKKLIALFLATTFAAPAFADQKIEMNNIAQCIAFVYQRYDLDGKKEIPTKLLPGLNALNDALLFRAAALQLTDEQTQEIVVKALNEQNITKATKGMAVLEQQYGTLCKNIAATLATPDTAPSDPTVHNL